MQATLDSFALKRLHRALTCLTRYGDELTIYATSEFLSLSTTNSSMSAYCHFKYEKGFFSRYTMGQSCVSDDDDVQEVVNAQGQLLTKSLLSVLKHRTVEKSVERCDISIAEGASNDQDEGDTLESRLIVKLHCKHGVTKTHKLLLQTPTSLLTPSMPSADIPESHLVISAHALKDLLEPFAGSGGDPQLIWTFGEEEILIRSWDGGVGKGNGDGVIIQLATELRISAQEFEGYEICEEVREIAFHLREFNATVGYAEGMSLGLSLRFANQVGSPLFIEVEGDDMQGLFVISTSDLVGRGSSNGAKMGQGPRKRARDDGEPPRERPAPRMRKPMKVVQRVDHDDLSRSTSRPARSVPPSQGTTRPDSLFSQTDPGQTQHAVSESQMEAGREPLFLASQTADCGLEGVEDMTAEEVEEMLEGEGADVTGTEPSATPPCPSRDDEGGAHAQEEADWDDMEFEATQMDRNTAKRFRPIFDD